jgi:hypothetical protein
MINSHDKNGANIKRNRRMVGVFEFILVFVELNLE